VRNPDQNQNCSHPHGRLALPAGGFCWPGSQELIAANSGDDFGKVWRLMPLFWKLWFVLSLVVGLAVMFAVLIL